jgi:hypothetical protein
LFWVLEASSHLLEKVGVLFDCGETLCFFFGGFPNFLALHLHLSYKIFERGEGFLKKKEKKSVVFFP